MRKKIIISLILSLFVIFTCVENSMALSTHDSNYYTNDNGVTVSEKEYQFIEKFYGKEYFNKMSIDDYEWIEDLNIDQNEIEIRKNLNSSIVPFGTSTTQYGKNLKIVKSCNSNCTIIVKCQWNLIPSIKSYDVIGARLSNTSLVSDIITTKISSSEGTEYSTNLLRLTNGFGVSVKLPTNGTNISVEQKYTVSTGGIVYASYQHAQSNISLASSKQYTIMSGGYGNVFGFYGGALNVYDQMAGVDISL